MREFQPRLSADVGRLEAGRAGRGSGRPGDGSATEGAITKEGQCAADCSRIGQRARHYSFDGATNARVVRI